MGQYKNKKKKIRFEFGLIEFGFYTIVTIIFGGVILYGVQNDYLNPIPEKEISQIHYSSYEEIINYCQRETILETASCVSSLTNKFFYYNISNLGKDLDLETLISEGGTCLDWMAYYNNIGRAYRYNTEEVIIKTGEDSSHAFSVWSTGEAYCDLDETAVSCFEFKKNGK